MIPRICGVAMLLVLLAACTTSPARVDPPTTPPPPPTTHSIPPAAPPLPTAPPAPTTATPHPAPNPPADTSPEQGNELAVLDATRRPPRDSVALARALGNSDTSSPVARTTPLEVQVGDVERFWVNTMHENYQVSAELRYAGPVVLMYVEQGVAVEQATLETAARRFEQERYPQTRDMFGSEWQPGVDGDNRITILNGRSTGSGVVGYFSSRDSLPQQVNRFSNEREMFYMNIEMLNPAFPAYLDTLTHEFQHMIHWNEQPASATWFNEGCATLAQELNGSGSPGYDTIYLNAPDTQLNAWSDEPMQSLAHYGAANLFMRYVYTHYTSSRGLLPLIRADAGHRLPMFVEYATHTHADIGDFGDLVANWAIANLLNDAALADGRYAYAPGGLPMQATPTPLEAESYTDTVHQFGVDYLELPPGPLTLHFSGNRDIALVGAMPRGQYAWWSGRGDASQATLTRAVDLRGVESATLHFDAWYELEQGYDYAFVSVSTDSGTTWETLPTTSSTSDDPQGMNYGNGFTGVSGGDTATSSTERGQWSHERVDLSRYAGQQVLLRFWQINDEGYNAPGLLLDTIHIPEIGYRDDVEAGSGGWQAEGFVRVDGAVPQQWELRLVRTAADGSTRIEPLQPDARGNATATLPDGTAGVLVVVASTPHTTEAAEYHLTLEQP